jgi:flagellar biosynthesis/type III secretory pathway ATPase
MPAIAAPDQYSAARNIRQALAAHHDAEDLIQLGAYVAGSIPVLDAGIRLRPQLLEFLRQDHTQESAMEETQLRLLDPAARLDAPSRVPFLSSET